MMKRSTTKMHLHGNPALALAGMLVLAMGCGEVSSELDAGNGRDGPDAGPGEDAEIDAGSQTGCDEGFAGSDCQECVTFVDGDSGAAENSGLSWEAPLPTVQAGIDLAGSRLSDEIATCSVWVSDGIYVPGSFRTDSFELAPNVHVYGGFAGGESAQSERDVGQNETILSGDIAQDDEAGNADTLDDNAFHVVVGADDALLDGFTITAGEADGEDNGAGVLNKDASPTLRKLTITGNSADSLGGGMFITGSGTPTLRGVEFSNNSADSGAAIAGSATITNALFVDNTSTDGGGAIDGGGTIANASFIDNSAPGSGGAINAFQNTLHLTNAVFVGNSAEFGGAISTSSGDLTLTNVTFYGNTADTQGGAMKISQISTAEVRNTILWGDDSDLDPEVHSGSQADTTISHSIVQGGRPEGVAEEDFDDNLDEDPQFRDPDVDDVRLLESSPAIDAGDSALSELPDEDRDGNPRIVDGDGEDGAQIDIGAYEFQP